MQHTLGLERGVTLDRGNTRTTVRRVRQTLLMILPFLLDRAVSDNRGLSCQLYFTPSLQPHARRRLGAVCSTRTLGRIPGVSCDDAARPLAYVQS